MINFFTGKPGQGKSYHMARIIAKELKRGKNVIANFEIDENAEVLKSRHPEKNGTFVYVPNYDLLDNAYRDKKMCERHFSYLDGLKSYALQFHKRNSRDQIIEHQTILVLDECQELFNSRTWNRKDRLEWCSFFREHRKYGFDVYLISQDDKVIDKQIRAILQNEYEHRCVNNYKGFGSILGLLSGGKLFVCIERTYMLGARSVKDSRLGATYFRGNKKYYALYDSYKTFHTVGAAGNREAVAER